jgi:hypothetical protein
MRNFMLNSVATFATAAVAETGSNKKNDKAPPKTAKEKAGEHARAKPAKELVTVKQGALSLDVGPTVIAGLHKSMVDEEKANKLMEDVKSKRYDLLAQTTLAIVKAAKADNTIDLVAALSGDPKLMGKLNDQLGLALGFREVIQTGEKKRIAYSKAVSKYFPSPKDDKNSIETKRKSTLRSNFLHMLKKCAQTACAIVEKDIHAKMDKDSGTLLISGPTVEKTFGAKEVLLNEKQVVQTGNTSTQLKEKPSFTALAAVAAEAHGAVVKRGSNTRGTKVVTDPDQVIEQLAASLVAAVNNIKDKPSERQRAALKSVQSAIANVL